MSRAAREDFAAEDRRIRRASHDRGTNPASAYQRERTFMGGLTMKKNLWRRRFAATIAGGTLAINASHVLAVDFANITATGDGTPTLSIDAGQGTVANAGLGTEGFFVEAATGEGIYPVRIGDSASDDFSSGVLLGSIRENPNRTNPLGSVYYPFSSVAADSNYGTPNGTLRLVVDSGGGGIAGGVGNANMAAAYFPFSQGWVGGTIRQNANGTPPNANSSLNGIDLVDLILGYGADGGGRNHVKIAGVDDSRPPVCEPC